MRPTVFVCLARSPSGTRMSGVPGSAAVIALPTYRHTVGLDTSDAALRYAGLVELGGQAAREPRRNHDRIRGAGGGNVDAIARHAGIHAPQGRGTSMVG